MEILKVLIAGIPAAAASPYSLTAYGFALAAWVAVAFRVRRHSALLNSLGKLPPKDRLAALNAEIGAVKLTKGLSPEQWLRSRIHSFYLIGFLVLCATVVLLLVVALSLGREKPGEAEITITQNSVGSRHPSREFAAFAATQDFSRNSLSQSYQPTIFLSLNLEAQREFLAAKTPFPFLAGQIPPTTYSSTLQNGVLVKTPDVPYLAALRAGGRANGVRHNQLPFDVIWPTIDFHIVNNGKAVLQVTGIELTIQDSVPNTTPIPVFDAYSIEKLVIRNEGWGKAIDPQLSILMSGSTDCESANDWTAVVVPKQNDLVESAIIPLGNLVPDVLRKHSTVCVSGELAYRSETGEHFKFPYLTVVALQRLPAAFQPPSATYDVKLVAGKKGYSLQVPVSHVVEPGKSDLFTFVLSSDRWASFRFSAKPQSQGQALKSKAMLADFTVFAPRHVP